MPTHWSHVEALFERALTCPPTERAGWLDHVCRQADGRPDAALRAELERLLAHDDAATTFFGGLGIATERVLARGSSAPERVGPWRITREVGRGGMGRVYEGRRDDGAFEQRVAVKVVESAAPGLVRRFELERRILAGLHHEGIARLLDGGGLPDGRPYLVMEFVVGEPLTAFADARRLDVDARLGLLVRVCDAVAHAHRALVVHRDLKPSNVLVEDGRGGPAVKLLDFGIARLLDPAADDSGPPDGEPPDDSPAGGPAGDALGTQAGQRLLTPAYAAPEQLHGDRVSTATDVYALGVLLVELLTGRQPDAGSLPSALALAGGDAEPRAARRRATPARLAARLRGDLDAVARRALAADPAARYGSADALAADLRRHLACVPVEARPATTAVRARAFVRRHRFGSLAAGLAVVALVGGTALTSWQATRAARDRDRAVATADFVLDLFGDLDPNDQGSREVSALTLLDRATGRLQPSLADDPLTRAAVGAALGRAYGSLGVLDRAEALQTAALEVRRARLGPGDAAALESAAGLGELLTEAGRFDEAEALLQGALAAGEAALGARHPAVAGVRHALGSSRVFAGDFAGAEAPLRQALADRRAALGPATRELAQSRAALGNLLRRQGRLLEAEGEYRAASALFRRLYGPTHPRLGLALNELGLVRKNLGDYAGAEPVYREALALLRAALGDTHPDVADALSNLGLLLKDRALVERQPRLFAPADSLLAESLRIYRAAFGDANLLSAHTEAQAAMLALHRGDPAAAEPRFRRALAWHDAARTPALHTMRPYALMGLGETLVARGQPLEAEGLLREALRIRETATPGHWRVADVQSALAECLAAQGRLSDARRMLGAAEARVAAGEGEFGVTRLLLARRRAALERAEGTRRQHTGYPSPEHRERRAGTVS